MGVQIFSAGLIDKNFLEKGFVKKLSTDFRKSLGISKKAVNFRELNTFLLFNSTTEYSPELMERMISLEKGGRLQKRFKTYYRQLESFTIKALKNNRELKETSQIILDFVKQIDSSLTQKFRTLLTDQVFETLPKTVHTTNNKTIIACSVLEDSQCRIFLSGVDSPVFSGRINADSRPEDLINTLLVLNFLLSWTQPTLEKLTALESVLDQFLELLTTLGVIKTADKKLQEKTDLFFRILIAKLSSISEVARTIFRIFELHTVLEGTTASYKFRNTVNPNFDLEVVLTALAKQTQQGRHLLQAINPKIQQTTVLLRDYCEDNGVERVPRNKFKAAIEPFASLSVDLFIETEVMKTWGAQFGGHIPYFSFNHNRASQQQKFTNNENLVILSVRQVHKNYQLGKTTVYALRGINLDIYEGEFISLVGNSGAGKTTLLNCMAGLDSPSAGKILFRGKDLHAMNDKRRSKSRLLEMGFIFQNYALLPHYNTRENVALPADLAGFSKQLKQRIEELLEGVGINLQAKQFPAQLSGGQMQRVSIARALTNRPAIIFADEPTGDLDSETGKQVMELLKLFHEETKTTIIVITHEEDIAAYAERQIEMRDGLIQ